MEVKDILKKLVSFDVLGGQSNLSIIHWIKDYLKDREIESTLVYNPEKTKASLHCRIGPSIDGGIILSGHTDVVPVKGQPWDTAPFELTPKEGKLYGRGSCDMKGFIACCLSMIPSFKSADLKKPIYFAFSYDEEIGCLSAPELIEAIKAFYPEKPKYALIGEPSLMQTVIGQKGICVFETEVNGSAGHSSRIRDEVSAIHEASRLIIWLENKMNALIESGQIDDRFNPPHTSIHVGQFNGGIAPNVIADKVSFKWDVRVIPKDKLEDILEDFENYCQEVSDNAKKKFPGFEIKTSMHHPPVPPLDTMPDDTIVSMVNEWTGNTEWDTVSYAAEAGQFHEGGFESIICGPGSIAQAHRANEFVAEDELAKCQNMLNKMTEYFTL